MKALDPARTSQRLTSFLSVAFRKAGFFKAVIALSGGVDSSTSCSLMVRALGAKAVYPVLLPYGNLNEQGVKDARLLARLLAIPVKNISMINIKPLVDPIIILDPGMDQARRGNIMARVRMTLLFDQAKKKKALVVGTENRTEHLLGYFTRFGDEASDIEPLRNLYKTQVYQLAKYLNIPKSILTKAPTAGLWPGQTDEGEFGFSYREADEILSLIVDKKKTVKEVAAFGFSEKVIKKVIKRRRNNDFKHHLPLLP